MTLNHTIAGQYCPDHDKSVSLLANIILQSCTNNVISTGGQDRHKDKVTNEC